MTDLSLRQMIRERWRDHIEGKEDVDLKVLADQCALDLLAVPEFRERFLQETVRPVVYDVGIGFVNSSRREAQRSGGGAKRVKLTEVARILEEEGEGRWSKWFEHDPLSGKHILLFKMTKEQALAAAKARRERALPDLRVAGLLELAAGRLQKGQRIEEKWTEAQLDELEQRILVGRAKVSLGPVGVKALHEYAELEA
jgi:hypothetical protein